MNTHKKLNTMRRRRAIRTRATCVGTATRPRLSFFKSNTRVYAQFIDDNASKTIMSAWAKKKDASKTLGTAIVAKAKEKGILAVTIDRGRYAYHGVLKTIVEQARAGGITI